MNESHQTQVELLTVRQLCDHWQVSRMTLNTWRKRGDFPPEIRLGDRSIRFRLCDVTAFEEAGLQ